MCIVVLAVGSSIGFALLSDMTLQLETKTSFEGPKLTQTVTQAFHIMGDPIDDPKPNNHNK